MRTGLRNLAGAFGLAATLALAGALAGCGDDPPPEQRPGDLTIRYVWDLAPADVKGEMAIGPEGARYRETRGESVVRFRFSPKPEQLDALWAALRAQRVDTIDTEAADAAKSTRKGAETLTVNWGDQRFTIRDGADRSVAEDARERWRRIQLALRDLILAERSRRGLPE